MAACDTVSPGVTVDRPVFTAPRHGAPVLPMVVFASLIRRVCKTLRRARANFVSVCLSVHKGKFDFHWTDFR